IRTLSDHQSKVRGASFSPDGRLLATYDRDSSLVFWNWEAGEVAGRLNPFGDEKETFILDGITFAPDGRTAALRWVGESGDAMLLDVDSHRLILPSLQSIGTAYIQVGSVVFSPDGQRLAFEATDGTSGEGEIVQVNLNPVS